MGDNIHDKSSFTAKEFELEQGLKLTEDSYPYLAPVGIALFKNDKSLLYVVTELRGALKAKGIDGKVSELLVDTSIRQPRKELPAFDGENGLAGVCVTEDGNTLFTTGVTQSGWGMLNKISRWQRTGPTGWKMESELTDIFRNDPAGASHQIGHCHIGSDGKLWVGVGDGHHVPTAHSPDHSNGKILRVNLDFTAPKDNPFYRASQPKAVRNYVYATGLRNPWAMTEIRPGKWLLADNGPDLDRLVWIEKGKDYPWDNTSESFEFGNLLTFHRPIGPAGMVYVPKGHPLKTLAGNLVIAASHKSSLVSVPFDPELGVRGPQRVIVKPYDIKNRGNHDRRGDFAGIFLTHDSLLVTYIRTLPKGGLIPSGILKISAQENNAAVSPEDFSGEQLVHTYGCRGCHVIAQLGANQGPSLDGLSDRLLERISDAAYKSKLATITPASSELDQLRSTILSAKATENEKVEAWIASKILNPKFDSDDNAMPTLSIKPPEAKRMAEFLRYMTDPSRNLKGWDRLQQKIMVNLERNPRVPIILALIAGLFLGLFFTRVAGKLKSKLRR